MKSHFLGFIAAAVVFSHAAFASNSLINLKGDLSSKKISKVYGVPVSETGDVVTSDKGIESLTVVGASLRKKDFLPAYVGEVLVPNAAAAKYADVNEGNALDFLSQQPAVAMDMYVVMLTGIPTFMMSNALDESRASNAGTTFQDSGDLNTALNGFASTVRNYPNGLSRHSHLQLVWLHRDGDKFDYVGYAVDSGTPVWTKGPRGYARAVLSYWFGEVKKSDTELLQTKKDLVNATNAKMKAYLKGHH